MAHPATDVVAALLALAAPAGADANGVLLGTGALAGVRIFDGPPLSDVEQPDVVGFGLSVEAELSGYLGDTTPGWGDRRTETFSVTCLAQSWSGETPMAPRRARVFALVDAVRALVDADRQLGGVCDYARLTTWSAKAIQDPSGALAQVEFAIAVDATRFTGA